ncbi:hypothetical protein [Planktothrix mougeotii]|uniref:Uncharacterized protein n=1 Tax=Planktothrix mougeotii LEGE 06226 TaxID=1828728 RepID=A0ABR9U5X7_9CYAN|nr:hypothetical protein [Planktothrix mougeotii]MBE9141848.1 hypothetical protein [Planktothrix mougeotii LEGE 06226]
MDSLSVNRATPKIKVIAIANGHGCFDQTYMFVTTTLAQRSLNVKRSL